MTSSFHDTRWTLVSRSRGSDTEARAALSELCDAYYAPVVAFLRRDGRDEDAARDLAHDFFAKLLALQAAYQAGEIALVFIALLATILSAYYYLRIVAVLLERHGEPHNLRASWPALLVTAASFTALIWLSILPEHLLQFLGPNLTIAAR